MPSKPSVFALLRNLASVDANYFPVFFIAALSLCAMMWLFWPRFRCGRFQFVLGIYGLLSFIFTVIIHIQYLSFDKFVR